MSYISTMAVNEGIIMLADMQVIRGQTEYKAPSIATTSYHKLFSIGDNIGIAICTNNSFTRRTQSYSQLIKEFCNDNVFQYPHDAAIELQNYLSKVSCSYEQLQQYGEDQYVIHVAGYNKPDTPTNGFIHTDGVYSICTIKDMQEKKIEHKGQKGYWQCGNMIHVSQYVEKINNDKERIDRYTLQDAVDTSKAIFDVARALEHHVDHIDTISENFEMIAITKDGIQWVKKHELRIKENNNEKLEVKNDT